MQKSTLKLVYIHNEILNVSTNHVTIVKNLKYTSYTLKAKKDTLKLLEPDEKCKITITGNNYLKNTVELVKITSDCATHRL